MKESSGASISDAQSQSLVDTLYSEKKRDTKRLLDKSKAKLHEIDDELRTTFEELERRGTIHTQTVEEFKEEQENYRARLELLTITNPGVVEQFHARQEEVWRYCLLLR